MLVYDALEGISYTDECPTLLVQIILDLACEIVLEWFCAYEWPIRVRLRELHTRMTNIVVRTPVVAPVVD